VWRTFKPGAGFHLAGRIGGTESELDRDHRLATVNLLAELRHECPAARVVHGSTAAVYAEGGTATTPVVESDAACPRGSYGISKYACEQEARRHAEGGVEISKSLARVNAIEVRTIRVEGERSSIQEQWLSNAKLLLAAGRPR